MSSTSKPSQSQSYVTHPALHLRDARDAHIVFEAVRLNVLPLITRRLTTAERDQLTSGNVFVWEEAEHKQGGLERWTDGRRWSQSRMRGDYLYYEEKIDITPEEKDAKAARRARKTLDPFSYQPPSIRRQDRPSKPDGLTKQTYSIQVQSSSYEAPRKWHIVAYFSGDDYTRLPVVDNYEYLRNIRIPDGVFFAKGNQTRLNRVLNIGEDREPYSAYPSEQPGWISPSWPASSSSSDTCTDSTDMSPQLSPSSSVTPGYSSRYTSTTPHHSSSSLDPKLSLPRLSTVAPVQALAQLNLQARQPGTPGSSYSPLTSEDRKALNSFRVVL